ncbi:MAG: GerW family sporulation protein [Clostridia bacterium]|nr:GerW family sporulation protein [Clostridia bacterium]
MLEHPIESLMEITMANIRDMVDVNTIIGEPITVCQNVIIVPISKVSFGFASGGSEFKGETIDEYTKKEKEEEIQYRLPFGGGAGAGVSINPVSFLIIQNGTVKLIPIENTSYIDRLIDYLPEAAQKINCFINNNIKNKNVKTEQLIDQIKKNTKDILNNTAQNKCDFKQKEFESKETNFANVNDIPENQEISSESDGEDL